MSPQFPPQRSKPMTSRSITASVRRGRKLLDLIERYGATLYMCTCAVHCANRCEPAHCNEQCQCRCHAVARDKQQLTRAINGMAAWARDLSRRHRGLSVGQELDETAASLGRLGGRAGTGEAKRRGKDDPDYYSQLAKARWKKPAPDKPAP